VKDIVSGRGRGDVWKCGERGEDVRRSGEGEKREKKRSGRREGGVAAAANKHQGGRRVSALLPVVCEPVRRGSLSFLPYCKAIIASGWLGWQLA
jgi:hypothetical protein